MRQETKSELKQDTNTITDTLNIDKQKQQTNNNRNITHPNHIEQTLTQEQEMNLKFQRKLCMKRPHYYHKEI